MAGDGIKPVHGITPETWNRVAQDSGAVYQNYGLPSVRLLGATSGGNTFTIEQEFREMTVDGRPGPVKGSQRLISSTAKLSVNLVEMTDENIELFLPASTQETVGNTTKFTRDCQISDGDYSDNITLVLKKGGTEELIALKVQNALHLGNFELGAAEDAEAVFPLEVTAHFDPAALEKEPWEVFNPLEVPVVTHTLSYIAGANGSIVGTPSQIVNDGEDGAKVYADADTNYQFDDWSDLSTDNPRQDLAVSADITVTANFSLI
jgi:hypothetical protein